MPEVYDWGTAPRELLEELAHESVTYWQTGGKKPPALPLIQALDKLCAAALQRLTPAEVDAEIVRVARYCIEHEWDESCALPWEQLTQLVRTPERAIAAPATAANDAAPAGCRNCPVGHRLRQQMVNIYHLTLTGGDAAATLVAIREASGPGAPVEGRGG